MTPNISLKRNHSWRFGQITSLHRHQIEKSNAHQNAPPGNFEMARAKPTIPKSIWLTIKMLRDLAVLGTAFVGWCERTLTGEHVNDSECTNALKRQSRVHLQIL